MLSIIYNLSYSSVKSVIKQCGWTHRLNEVPACVRCPCQCVPEVLSVLADLLVTQHDHSLLGVTCRKLLEF